ncbi:protein of unknown function [Taphrina deformans PYCC 5710]|uniref:Uncharacterized protein n=1 Tax=Taphrina deformans (strain PYCC 5710 / ATCC 11124 / CBS 356.35 / IMI 108563 / JCM 9778 / NBRC 8474) TaxID=1097556 RepID=R4XDQ2_TAPDE|nr:protein of unknown function [Taphrina deformans PYCC 5710]|eukprot:CCG83747.1 protein of unknown function [Taphrina deformans PYCC 5710]
MELVSSAGATVVSVEVNWHGWLNELKGRAAANEAYDNIFTKEVYRTVDAYRLYVNEQRVLAFARLNAKLERMGVSLPDTKSEQITRSKSLAVAEATEDELEAEKVMLKEANKVLKNDLKAWACVQKGLKGAILHQIEGKSARDAFLEVEKMYGESSLGRSLKLSADLTALRITDLSAEGVKEFLDKRHVLVAQLQELEPDCSLYTWEEQRKVLAQILPMEFVQEAKEHAQKVGPELTYNALQQSIIDATAFESYRQLHSKAQTGQAFYQNGTKGGNKKHGNNNSSNSNSSEPFWNMDGSCFNCKSTEHQLWECKAPGADVTRAKWAARLKKQGKQPGRYNKKFKQIKGKAAVAAIEPAKDTAGEGETPHLLITSEVAL